MDFKNKEQVKSLVKGCKNGERKSQRVLYENLYPKMLGICMRYSKDPAEAQDMVHDGFIKVFERIKSFNSYGSLEGWIRRLIVNNTIDYLRKKKLMKFNYGEESHIDNLKDENPQDKAEKELTKIKAEKIVEIIQHLSPAYRAVFNLYVVEDLSHKEIAERLNITVGTSKSNLSKAKVKIKQLFEEQFENYE